MEWESKTEADRDMLHKLMFSHGGKVGYLRASIHMANENAVLHGVSPEKYWKAGSREAFDFAAGYRKLEELGVEYVQAVINGKEMECVEAAGKAFSGKEAAEAISQALAKAGFRLGGSEQIQVYCGKVEGFGDAVKWLNEVYCFVEFGIKLQEAGLNPYPSISW